MEEETGIKEHKETFGLCLVFAFNEEIKKKKNDRGSDFHGVISSCISDLQDGEKKREKDEAVVVYD